MTAGTLYVVATPLGNLADASARAIETLRAVDIVACEDTRTTRTLLGHYGIEVRTVKAHVAKLMRKVGVQNRIALSVQAITRSLVPR